MRFNVTPKDIQNGIRNNCLRCPVASSIKRRFPNHDVWVTAFGIEIGNKHYPLLTSVNDFIEAFDMGELVKPFSFEIKGI